MKAMILKQFGGVENFAVGDIPDPQIADGEVLVKVRAIGIDVIDIKSRQGKGMTDYLPHENPIILGWDISGVVTNAGNNTQGFKIGDEVFGTINFPGPGSSYAELVAAHANQLAHKPDNISHAEAAAATQSPLTAWQALIDTGQIKKNDRVLIHGGAGGVGNYAIQIAHHMGCYVITTIAAEDTDYVKSIGADKVIYYKTQKFEDIITDLDFILDTIGGENFERSLKVLKPEGTIVLLPSDKKQQADIVAKEQNIKNYKHILMHSDGEQMRRIAEMLADGRMEVHIDKIFDFDQIPQAHQYMQSGKAKGKVVVTV